MSNLAKVKMEKKCFKHTTGIQSTNPNCGWETRTNYFTLANKLVEIKG